MTDWLEGFALGAGAMTVLSLIPSAIKYFIAVRRLKRGRGNG